MSGGYMGKILLVDLSRNELRDEELPEEIGRQFVGGYGIEPEFSIIDRKQALIRWERRIYWA